MKVKGTHTKTYATENTRKDIWTRALTSFDVQIKCAPEEHKDRHDDAGLSGEHLE
jgi:hypothetical protein